MQAIRHEVTVGADPVLQVPATDLPEGTVTESSFWCASHKPEAVKTLDTSFLEISPL